MDAIIAFVYRLDHKLERANHDAQITNCAAQALNKLRMFLMAFDLFTNRERLLLLL